MTILLAKSDGTSLVDHTRHVYEAMRKIMVQLVPDLSDAQANAALLSAAMHDLGKAHPAFQESLAGTRRDFDLRFQVPFRHEVASLFFLPCIDPELWGLVADMVIGHHKSVMAVDGAGKGILDLIANYGAACVFDRHFSPNVRWTESASQIFADYVPTAYAPVREQALEAFDYVVSRCESKGKGRNRWRGLLMAADHLASALQEDTGLRSECLFSLPDLAPIGRKANTADPSLYPLAALDTSNPRPHTLIVAPTGAGKTDYLLRRCTGGRVFYILPFQASINAMYCRLDEMLNGHTAVRTDIRRVHGASSIGIDGRDGEETILQQHIGASIKVCTPHQLAGLVFGLAGHEALALDLRGCNVILDEVHVYSEQTQAMVFEIVRSLQSLGCRIHVGSATLPIKLMGALIEIMGGKDSVHDVRLDEAVLATYNRHRLNRLSDAEEAIDFIDANINSGSRMIAVFNRVGSAQNAYRSLRGTYPDLKMSLLHSRFKRIDRASRENDITRLEHESGPTLLISTQTIEVSLDISYDAMVTECAPLDSLIQRFGRVNRRRVPAESRKIADVGVIAPPSDPGECKPYDADVLRRTWDTLRNCKDLRETELQAMIDLVYPVFTPATISSLSTLGPDGDCTLQELCNVPRSQLITALDIEGACAICKSDRAEYLRAGSKRRQQLEIPVSRSYVHLQKQRYERLEVGNWPMVLPDAMYSVETGLSGSAEEEKQICTIL